MPNTVPLGKPTKILEVGDSNTSMLTAYRASLKQQLEAEGYLVDFVGPYTDGSPDGEMAASPGRSVEMIEAEMPGWLTTYLPDDGTEAAIVIMAGTANMFPEREPDHPNPITAPARMGSILDMIHAVRPDVPVIVSTILPIDNTAPASAARVSAYNVALVDVVRGRAMAGHNVRPMVLGPCPNDGFHFIPAGGQVAAAYIMAELRRVLRAPLLGKPTWVAPSGPVVPERVVTLSWRPSGSEPAHLYQVYGQRATAPGPSEAFNLWLYGRDLFDGEYCHVNTPELAPGVYSAVLIPYQTRWGLASDVVVFGAGGSL